MERKGLSAIQQMRKRRRKLSELFEQLRKRRRNNILDMVCSTKELLEDVRA